MSDKTAHVLEEAMAEEERQRAAADRAKRQCLAFVARGIPARVENVAKRSAHRQPEVARELGVDGIRILRSELAAQAAVVASELEASSEQIKWPNGTNISTREVHSAMFKFLYGRRVDNLAGVLKRHGFSVDEVGDSQHSMLPQDLYSEADFAALAKALNALGQAQLALAAAEAANDRDIVESLWE